METITRPSTLLSPSEEARLDREVVDTLRRRIAARKADTPPAPTVKQVQAIVTSIEKRRTLPATAKHVGVSEEFVLNVVSDLGTWLVHSLRPTVTRPSWQLSLFSMGDDPGVPLGGFEPWSEHRRDIANALGAIAGTKPDSETVARFVSRTYSVRAAQLTYPLVVGVWGQVIRDRLPSLEQLSDDLTFLELALDAYDLLDVARADGVAAVRALACLSPDDPEAVLAAARSGAWLCEAQAQSLMRAAELADTSPAARKRLERDLRVFAVTVNDRPESMLPAGVRHLTLGQVQRICAQSGIKIESDNKREEAEIRATLKDLGLASDLDKLVHDALRLAEAGLIDEFWDVMSVRVDGDPVWVDQLAQLLARA